MKRAFMISCEHAVNDVPLEFRPLFEGKEYELETHRGWDPGSWEVATRLAMLLGAPLIVSSVTRLLVDFNRREENPDIFSEFSRDLPEEKREFLIKRYHRPYRRSAEDMVEIARLRKHPVVHLSVHTFTPELNGEVRDCDIGLLFDPDRQREAAFCEEFAEQLRALAPGLRVRMNYPYRGTDDGLTTWLREKFPADEYLGIELELNQGPFKQQDKSRWREMREALLGSVEKIIKA